LTAFQASSHADKPTVGAATYNVSPDKAGLYFTKIACFCFDEQVLAPGQSVEMPVVFYVDPAFADDPDLKDTRSIVLSYTFFRAKDEATVLAQAPKAQTAITR
jgi:cytochrome c oxidase assembly protein subunit 11